MIKRWVVFAVCMFAGGGLGFFLASEKGLAVGMMLAAFAWLAFDSLYVMRLLRWLRTEQGNETPAMMASPALPIALLISTSSSAISAARAKAAEARRSGPRGLSVAIIRSSAHLRLIAVGRVA